MVVGLEPGVSIGYPGTHVNVHPGLKATVGLDANRPKFARVSSNKLSNDPTSEKLQVKKL